MPNITQLDLLVALVRRTLSLFRPGEPVELSTIARSAGVDKAEALAALNVLRKQGLGNLGVEVVNAHAQTVGVFSSFAALPEQVEDEYGEKTHVDTHNTRVVFVLAAGNAAGV